jgi:murein DD-endopeptidase MepM/ murein hydrolase activator NlpD
MDPRHPATRLKLLLLAFGVVLAALLACARTTGPAEAPYAVSKAGTPLPASQATRSLLPTPRPPGAPFLSPTPDDPHALPTLRSEADQYVVQSGDTLAKIADKYGVTVEDLVRANDIADPNLVGVGQMLIVPVATPASTGPDFKVIPDSELVYGPAAAGFDLAGFIRQRDGYLAGYEDEIDGETFPAAEIIQRIAQEYSVNPRLLLAVLEHQSHWLTKAKPKTDTLDYPLGLYQPARKGLYHQLAWAADNLNRGFYVWRVGGTAAWTLSDGSLVRIAPTINAGTAGVQAFFALVDGETDWRLDVGEKGLYATYDNLFGNPFDVAVEPLVPEGLTQPKMQLPFERGAAWSFTGGPHGGWGDGSAWAALDFAPPGDALGCVSSDAWDVAVANGPIVRAGDGEVIQDIDLPEAPADGLEQTGWVVLYMHVETRGRVKSGAYLHAGEHVGHPSCEGGVSTGTHLHLARRYNGEWIPADQDIPFVLDGWVSRGDGRVYDGFLDKNGKTIEAWEGRSEENAIHR